jgi:hypothetical protein
MGGIGGGSVERLSEFGCLLLEDASNALRIGGAGNEDGFRHMIPAKVMNREETRKLSIVARGTVPERNPPLG